MKALEAIDAGLMIGMDKKAILVATTPGELQDLLQMRSNREYKKRRQ